MTVTFCDVSGSVPVLSPPRFQVRISGGHLISCAVVLAEQYVILGKAVMRIDCAAK